MSPEILETIESDASGGSYSEVLRSSATIGGSTIVTVLLGVVRTKAMAILLGPAGFGLFGVYWSIATLARTLAGMGVHGSGVRQIAHAVGTNDAEQIARTTITLRRVSILLGFGGLAILVVFARSIAKATFGTSDEWRTIALLSFVVLFQLVSDGQSALLQGMRRIRDLAQSKVFGTIAGTVLSLVIVYRMRDRGIVLSIVTFGVMSFLFTWWYSRKVRIQPIRMSGAQIREETKGLLHLGFAFLGSSLATSGMSYLIRIIVLRNAGDQGAGYYSAAWTLSGFYVGVILEAMGADFYPRLTACANDNASCSRLINEQTEVGMLLAGPGIIATLTFSPLVVLAFYSGRFAAAIGILRWMCLGTILQVATWPMGYLIAAKGRQAIYFACEFGFGIMNVSLAFLCIQWAGLNGVGFAFFLSSALYGLILFPIAHKLCGLEWSSVNKNIGLAFLGLISLVFAGIRYLPITLATGFGFLMFLLSVALSIRALAKLVPWSSIPPPIRVVLVRLNMAPL